MPRFGVINVRLQPASGGLAVAPDDDVPLLVRVLAGNSVTGAFVFSCLNTADTGALRQLHPELTEAVAVVPWADTVTRVVDVVRWRAALPGAVGARLVEGYLFNDAVVTALAGITALNLHGCYNVTDELLLHLPTSLRTLNVSGCYKLTAGASFAHLAALVSLDCSDAVAYPGTTNLPPTLHELNISTGTTGTISSLFVPRRVTGIIEPLVHLSQLRVLRACGRALNDGTLAFLPPSLVELHVTTCSGLAAAVSFTHLHALQTLDAAGSDLCDAALTTLPPSLAHLDVLACSNLTPAAVLPPLPALRLLDVSATNVGDALVASLPAALEELRIEECRIVTACASLDHVRALRALFSIRTALDPATIAACHARGCVVSTASTLRKRLIGVNTLVVLPDGRLPIGDAGGANRVAPAAPVPAANPFARPVNPFVARAPAVGPDGARAANPFAMRREGAPASTPVPTVAPSPSLAPVSTVAPSPSPAPAPASLVTVRLERFPLGVVFSASSPVVAVVRESSVAAAAGVQPGWVLVNVGGQDMSSVSGAALTNMLVAASPIAPLALVFRTAPAAPAAQPIAAANPFAARAPAAVNPFGAARAPAANPTFNPFAARAPTAENPFAARPAAADARPFAAAPVAEPVAAGPAPVVSLFPPRAPAVNPFGPAGPAPAPNPFRPASAAAVNPFPPERRVLWAGSGSARPTAAAPVAEPVAAVPAPAVSLFPPATAATEAPPAAVTEAAAAAAPAAVEAPAPSSLSATEAEAANQVATTSSEYEHALGLFPAPSVAAGPASEEAASDYDSAFGAAGAAASAVSAGEYTAGFDGCEPVYSLLSEDRGAAAAASAPAVYTVMAGEDTTAPPVAPRRAGCDDALPVVRPGGGADGR